MTEEKNRPIHEVKHGAVKFSVWKNQNKMTKDEFIAVSVGKLYKKGEEWKMTSSYGVKDLENLSLGLAEVLQWAKENGWT